MKILKIILWLYILLLISSCGTVKEAFTNQRKNSSEEFLVEKKSPLVMPPDYTELPIPQEMKKEKIDKNSLKNIITEKQNEDVSFDKNTNKSFEESILNKIKNNAD